MCLITFVIVPLFHGSVVVTAVVCLVLLWVGGVAWQRTHPDWRAPLEEGLPQLWRLFDFLFQVTLWFRLVLILVPIFQKVGDKTHHHRPGPAHAVQQ